MDMRITHPEFVKRRLVVSTSGEAGPTLRVDGVDVPRSGLEYIVEDDAGRARPIGVFEGFDGPSVSVSGEPVTLTPELPWYAMAMAAIPFLLVPIGGLLGGVCGGAGGALTLMLWRSQASQGVKIAGSLGIIAGAYIGFFVLIVAIRIALGA